MEKIAFSASDLDNLVEQSSPNLANTNVGGIIDILLTYIFPAAGIAMLLYLIWGGFQIMLSGGNPKNIEDGKGKITNAIIGFVLVFAAYWIVQIVAIALGLTTTFGGIFR